MFLFPINHTRKVGSIGSPMGGACAQQKLAFDATPAQAGELGTWAVGLVAPEQGAGVVFHAICAK